MKRAAPRSSAADSTPTGLLTMSGFVKAGNKGLLFLQREFRVPSCYCCCYKERGDHRSRVPEVVLFGSDVQRDVAHCSHS